MSEIGKRILIVGAGEAGRMVVSEIARHGELGLSVVGFLDDDDKLAGNTIDSIPVLGGTGELEEVAARHRVDEIIIAIPTAPGRFVRDMVKRCSHTGLPFKIVPGVMEIIKGDVHIEQIREVRVEDLLGRETVDFDLESAKKVLAGKRILITGAGGSIGSELCRQLSGVAPGELILLGRGENRIFDIEEDLGAREPSCEVKTVINDLRDPDITRRLVHSIAPDVIYHTAAHKHVHYMERDPEEAVLNNIGASVNIVHAAEDAGTERFVFISTDKAANPSGVMGATKRLVELYLRSRRNKSSCRFITVRFGNVIGSTGSVIPHFVKQVRGGGPVTVSDPQATRYFMTVREASLLVIHASIIGKGGETFILEMGEPINILEIARDVVVLAGREPDTEIEIVLTGLRDGEKLHEELICSDEQLVALEEEKILLAKPSTPVDPDIERGVGEIIASARVGERGNIFKVLSRFIPSFDRSD